MTDTPDPRPVDPGPPPVDSDRERVVRDLLLRWGWTPRPGGRWADPVGANPGYYERRPAVELPAIGGGKEVVHQIFCSPAAWDYDTEEAFLVQLQRGVGPEQVAELIESKKRELEELKRRLAEEQAAGGASP
jgi:hypothetical protein